MKAWADKTQPTLRQHLAHRLNAHALRRQVRVLAARPSNRPEVVLAVALYALFLKLGDSLTITSDATPGTQFTGQISRISPSADQNSRAFEVEVTIPNEQGLLKPGMIASLNTRERTAPEGQSLIVPLTAITHAPENPDAYAVMVMEQRDGKTFAQLRPVTLGESVGNAIIIKTGVTTGELVVTTGVSQVVDGEQVLVVQ